MNDQTSIEAATRRLAQALDTLDAAVERRREADRGHSRLEDQVQAIFRDADGLRGLDMRRTHHCGELRAADAGKRVLLMGWVHRRRDLGGVLFLHLRDREGVTQIVFRADGDPAVHAKADLLGSEYVIAVEGVVDLRSKDTINPAIATGEVEIVCEKLHILNTSKVPPFPMEDTVEVKEVLSVERGVRRRSGERSQEEERRGTRRSGRPRSTKRRTM